MLLRCSAITAGLLRKGCEDKRTWASMAWILDGMRLLHALIMIGFLGLNLSAQSNRLTLSRPSRSEAAAASAHTAGAHLLDSPDPDMRVCLCFDRSVAGAQADNACAHLNVSACML